MKKFICFALFIMCFCPVAGAETKKDALLEKSLFETGVQAFKQGQYQQAVDIFSELIAVFPENADAFKNRGVAYMKLEKFDHAIADFESAKAITPDLKGVYSNLGVIWYYKENYEKAIENYNREIALSPENAAAYFNRALCMTKLGRTEEALADLSTAIAISPDFYWAICYKADLLADKGQVQQAIALYEMAIQKDHQTPYAIEKLARLQESATDASGEAAVAASVPGADSLSDTEPSGAADQAKGTDKAGKPKQAEAAEQSKDTEQPEASSQAGDEKAVAGSDAAMYTLQAGAFLIQENARNLREKLAEKGFEAKILVLTDKKQRSWYLVRSGVYPSREHARKEMAALEEIIGTPPAIRPQGVW